MSPETTKDPTERMEALLRGEGGNKLCLWYEGRRGVLWTDRLAGVM
jgi:hypothetical protein